MQKIIAIIIIALALGGLGTIGLLIKKNKQLNAQVSDQSINLKALQNGTIQYKDKYDQAWSRVIQQRQSLAELKANKDSTVTALMNKLFAAGVKLKDIKNVSTTATTLQRDTVIVYKKGTVNKTFDFSKPPYIKNTVTVTDTTASNTLQVDDEITTFSHVKRETINPPKKFFLFRWFQKKHDVIYTDINHANKDINVKSSQQITILDSKGNPK